MVFTPCGWQEPAENSPPYLFKELESLDIPRDPQLHNSLYRKSRSVNRSVTTQNAHFPGCAECSKCGYYGYTYLL